MLAVDLSFTSRPMQWLLHLHSVNSCAHELGARHGMKSYAGARHGMTSYAGARHGMTTYIGSRHGMTFTLLVVTVVQS